MPLTAKTIDAAQPRPRKYRLADGGGLALLVHPNGGKYWIQRYRRPGSGKAAELRLGVYPVLTLKAAREKGLEARRLLSEGIDPTVKKRAAKLTRAGENSFEALATEFLAVKDGDWSAEHHVRQGQRLKKHAYPWLGAMSISDLEPTVVLDVLRKTETNGGADTAHTLKNLIGQICRYAIATGRGRHDPTADLRGALATPRRRHLGATTDPAAFGAMLRAIDDYQGTYPVRCALRLLPLTLARPGPFSSARWDDVNLDEQEWRYTEKGARAHIVPLCSQAVAIIRDLELVTRHRSEFLFPGTRSPKEAISNNTLNYALRRMGYSREEATAHGFRATARTLLDEVLGWPVATIEMQLAHTVRDVHGRAYNRTQYRDQRREMLQAWADYLDQLRQREARSAA